MLENHKFNIGHNLEKMALAEGGSPHSLKNLYKRPTKMEIKVYDLRPK